ncbi:MAG: hypothetical protein ACC656_15000, partial [Candidatus Heimdallarchaeota archaeon]
AYITDLNGPDPITVEVAIEEASSPGWYRIINLESDQIVLAGNTYLISLEALNSNSSTTEQAAWNREVNHNNQAASTTNWRTNNANSSLRINDLDSVSVDQSTLLADINTGDTVKITQISDTTKWIEYHIIDATDGTTQWQYTVNLIAQATAGSPDVGTNCDLVFTKPVTTSPTDYVFDTDYWLTNQPDWATFRGWQNTGGLPNTFDNNAYGFDVMFQSASVSDDWDLVAYSNFSGSGGGSSGGGTSADKVTYDNLNSGLTAINVQDAVDELDDNLWIPESNNILDLGSTELGDSQIRLYQDSTFVAELRVLNTNVTLKTAEDSKNLLLSSNNNTHFSLEQNEIWVRDG